MEIKSFFQFGFLYASSFTMKNDGYLHCKTVPWYILAVTTEGHYELEYDHAPSAVCEEGGAFFSAPGVPLQIRHRVNPKTGSMSVRYVHFSFAGSSSPDPFADRVIPVSVSRESMKKIMPWLERLLAEDESDLARNAFAFALVAELYKLTSANAALPDEYEYIRKIRRVIDGHPDHAVQVRELYRRASVSKSKFFLDFKRETGMTPADYVRWKRMEYAMSLLYARRDISIKEASMRCGWKNLYHFSREFKAYTGESPKKYRETLFSLKNLFLSK